MKKIKKQVSPFGKAVSRLLDDIDANTHIPTYIQDRITKFVKKWAKELPEPENESIDW